jgi:hypothetical protein
MSKFTELVIVDSRSSIIVDPMPNVEGRHGKGEVYQK